MMLCTVESSGQQLAFQERNLEERTEGGGDQALPHG